jgi:hypothetical protein
MWGVVSELLFSFWGVSVIIIVLAELLHHVWSVMLVKKLDRLFLEAKQDRDVDIIEQPHWTDFQNYWRECAPEFRAEMRGWAKAVGHDLDKLLTESLTQHISEDCAQFINPWDCVPITLLFRTFNTWKLYRTARRLQNQGFRSLYGQHCHLHYFVKDEAEIPKRELLVVFPQFSGEFGMVSVFSELKENFDVLFVCPTGTQLSWWQTPSRYSDALSEYAPVVLKYNSVSAVTWSAGNVHFQALDRYLEVKRERHRMRLLIRLDPLGYPSSNFFIFSGIPLPWRALKDKLLALGRNGRSEPVGWINYLGTYGFSWLLKSSHGYAYVKLGRMLRSTKLAPAHYEEHHFTASFDPCWQKDHFVFENDRKILCKNVTEHIMDGFHGLWLSQDVIRNRIFPILTAKTTLKGVH